MTCIPITRPWRCFTKCTTRGPELRQDFFFPVERWGKNPDTDIDTKNADIRQYEITVDGKKLPSTNVSGPKEEANETKSGQLWEENVSTIKSWKKSIIPFERNQTREVAIRYNAQYAENDESVSDDSHISDATFAYSLSPAATWKGPIGKGKIEINILHPEPEDVSIEKPKERFRKINDTHYEWTFENLKPTLADDIRIIAHSKYDSYPTGYSEEELNRHASYVLRDNQYFLDHTDYDATASSTLAPQGKRNYDVVNIKANPQREEQTPWAEGAEGDGLGESITLNVKRGLPLYGILIRPGYYEYGREDAWWKNNRIAQLEVTLNDEHTFTESIPDERFENPYLIRVRDYAKPVNKIKFVIKGVIAARSSATRASRSWNCERRSLKNLRFKQPDEPASGDAMHCSAADRRQPRNRGENSANLHRRQSRRDVLLARPKCGSRSAVYPHPFRCAFRCVRDFRFR